MTQILALDTGVAGLLTHPRPSPTARQCRIWLTGRRRAGDRLVLPAIVDYELRREYELNGARQALTHLDLLSQEIEYIALTTPALRYAARLWAAVRRQGRPTADPHALDGDVILAAQGLLLVGSGDSLMIATTNPGHLEQFATARLWTAI
jgi:predicted nucleic acid-binding protein